MQADVIQRNALFAISIVLVAVGVFFNTGSQGNEFLRAVCLKVGIVLFMLWLALPQLKKLNYWIIAPIGVAVIAVIVRPELIRVIAGVGLFLAPVLFLIWLLWLPSKKKSSPRR